MAKPDNLIDKRMVNALFKDAEASGLAKSGLGLGGKAGLGVVQKMMGGLWIGGKAWLTPDAITFEPNGINKLAHRSSGELTVSLPLSEVTSVEWRKAIATSIIDISTDERTLSIRGYNSKSFCEAIKQAVIAAGGQA